MSEIKIIKAKIKKLDIENMEEYSKNELNKRWVEYQDFYKTYTAQLCDTYKNDYVKIDWELYAYIDKDYFHSDDEFCFWNKNPDWTIDIFLQYYNCCSEGEVIEGYINNF